MNWISAFELLVIHEKVIKETGGNKGVLNFGKLNSEKDLDEQIVTPVKKLLKDKSALDIFKDSVAFQFSKGNDVVRIIV